MAKTVGEIASLVDGIALGDAEALVTGIAGIDEAGEGDLVFAESPKHIAAACASPAAAVIVHESVTECAKPAIRVSNPRLAFAKTLELFAPVARRPQGVHPTCVVGEGTKIGSNPSIGANSYIGCDCAIGDNVWIHPLVHIGDGVVIGNDVVLHPCVVLYDGVQIGNSVIVHSGAVIGADGFGYTRIGDSHYKIPQIGTVSIGDRVEIGANATIDRAKTGVTQIGAGTKIDNMVHVAHNCTIGENCLLIAQSGISGSVRIGDRAILTGQSGIKDHVSIGSDCVLAGRAGLMGDMPPGSFYSGYPARPHKDQMRVMAVEQRLPELLKTIRSLEKRVSELEGKK